MDDREALLRAVAANPDDDLPRLVLADWWDDHGEADHAAFIRAQVELGRTPGWEPFAVSCRHFHRDEWVLGTPFWEFLPRVDGHRLEWHPEYAFRRGLAWGLIVRDMAVFLEQAPRLFEIAPIGQLHLPTATLQQWRTFARAEWISRVKSIHFYGTSPPIEPVRELCASDRATALVELVFESSVSPGMPVLMSDLLASNAGRRLRSLELRVGPDSVVEADDLYESLALAESPLEVTRIALTTFPAGTLGLQWLFHSSLFGKATEIELAHVMGNVLPDSRLHFSRLTRLRVADCDLHRRDFERLLHPNFLPPLLRALDLSGNAMREWPRGSVRANVPTPGLRSLNLRRTAIDDRAVEELTRMWFWMDLVELDLRGNHITNRGVLALLDAPRPRDLAALLLGGNAITAHMAGRLRGHFGECVSFD